MPGIFKRLFTRKPSAPARAEQPANPCTPVWTTGALPEEDAEQFVGALRVAFAEELIGEETDR